MSAPELIERFELLDELLEPHRDTVGAPFTAYRNHAYRVLNFCAALTEAQESKPDDLELISIAAAFHDLGIWTHGTFDYLPPSRTLARDLLVDRGRADDVPPVDAMVLEHHKIRRYRGPFDHLVEPFRRADWIDVSLGLLRFGLPKTFLGEVVDAFPRAGFHGELVKLSLERFVTRPWSPLPMLRW